MYIFGRETMAHDCFDFGVVGDGEKVLAGLCEDLRREQTPTLQPGLLIRKNGNLEGEGVAFLDDLDHIDIPAVDLIDPFKYFSTIGKAKAVGTICTSRGCPYQCTFCQVPRTRYRVRSIDNVIREIECYLAKGINDFFFFDDLFNISKKRVKDFCRSILERKLKISWMFRGRVDEIDDEMLQLARQAGCHTVSVGIEDATDEGLKAIKKNISINQAVKAVRTIKRNKIRCSTNWIIGFPHHQKREDLERVLKTAIDIGADYAQFSILQCLPGSRLYEDAIRSGGINPSDWRDYVLKPVKKFAPPIWERHFSKKELYDFYNTAYRRYYLRPIFLIREALALRSLVELKAKLSSFLKIFL
jgi:radical SAM superfamily enzyme YgiQ (UPF0313 family)